MACVWLPRPFVWKEDHPMKPHFELKPNQLKDSIFEETDRDWRVAQVQNLNSIKKLINVLRNISKKKTQIEEEKL